jgi:hypothetical protein
LGLGSAAGGAGGALLAETAAALGGGGAGARDATVRLQASKKSVTVNRSFPELFIDAPERPRRRA